MSQPRMTDAQRHKLEALLLVAYGLLYRQALARAYTALGVSTEPVISADAQAWLQTTAEERAGKVQSGVNLHIEQALTVDGAPVEPDAADALLVTLRQEMETHNHLKLVPNMASQIDHQAQQDAYTHTTTADGTPAIDATPWVWTRGSGSDEPDSCQDAADASPAPYNALVDAAGGLPPIHDNCLCSLDPA